MREAILMVATGVKGVGKSYATLWKEVIPFARGMYTGKQRPVLIFDVNNEYQWTQDDKSNIYPKTPEDKKLTHNRPIKIKAIGMDKIPLLSHDTTGMIRRFAPRYEKDQRDKKGKIIAKKGDDMLVSDLKLALMQILRTFRNGLLVIEDLRALFGDHIPTDVSGAITRNRHKNLDVIWHLQSLGRLLPEYWENVNYVRFHHENNSVENAKDKLPDFHLFSLAELMVDSEYGTGNKRYYLYVDKDYNKLRGNYSKEGLYNAIDTYVRRNPRLVNNLLLEVDDQNRPVYNRASAMAAYKKQMFDKYQGIIRSKN